VYFGSHDAITIIIIIIILYGYKNVLIYDDGRITIPNGLIYLIIYDSSVSIATRLWTGQPRNLDSIPAGEEIFLLPIMSKPALGPT
jgi:hypothetical protein